MALRENSGESRRKRAGFAVRRRVTFLASVVVWVFTGPDGRKSELCIIDAGVRLNATGYIQMLQGYLVPFVNRDDVFQYNNAHTIRPEQ